MKLEDIGFYTLSDMRALTSSSTSPMQRCELILTDRCNFKCPYCRGVRSDCKGDMPKERVLFVLHQWILDDLKNVRFSGGEPTLYKHLPELVEHCAYSGVERIALSTNGSADTEVYLDLIKKGVNDFSISLDACCSSTGDMMSGKCGYFDKIIENIKILSTKTYVTVGVVLTDDNLGECSKIIEAAHNAGVADIRIIPAAQNTDLNIAAFSLPRFTLNEHPILKYRLDRMEQDNPFRGLSDSDSHTCHLLKDDSMVAGDYHFPCVIYFREQGNPIGKIGHNMRGERINWMKNTDTHCNKICKENCLDVCIAYNNKAETHAK
jgi:molybdenum cofactor biosynthesis enzyme MoaA